MTAIGLVVALRAHRRWVRIVAAIVGLLGAMALHSLWNSSTKVGGGLGTLVVAPFFLALTAALAVVVTLSVRREARIVREYMPEEVAPRDEVERLFSARARVADAWKALRTGGWRAVRARDDYVRALSASAFRNYREARAGESPKRPSPVVAGYQDALKRLLDSEASDGVQSATIVLEGEPVSAALTSDGLKECPDCAEGVRESARVCRHCGYRFEPASSTA
jgi:hypothetical protein